MIRHTILVDTDYKTGLVKNPYKDADLKKRLLKQKGSTSKDGILRSVKTLNKRSYLGYLFIKIEILALVLFAALYLFQKVPAISTWIPSVIVLGVAIVLWAIGRLPSKTKKTGKLVYFRIHVLLFTGVFGSGGYLWANELTDSNSLLTIIITALITVFVMCTHFPFLKGENILKL